MVGGRVTGSLGAGESVGRTFLLEGRENLRILLIYSIAAGSLQEFLSGEGGVDP